MRRDVDQIAPRARLAAGQMHVQHAERRGLGEHPRPGRGVEFVVARFQRQRIGAIGAAERTAVRQLGEQAERVRQAVRHDCHRYSSRQLLLGQPAEQRGHIGSMRSRGALKVVGKIVDDRCNCRFAGAALEDLGGDGVGLEHALGREQHPAALRLVVRQPHAARQPRLRVVRYR